MRPNQNSVGARKSFRSKESELLKNKDKVEEVDENFNEVNRDRKEICSSKQTFELNTQLPNKGIDKAANSSSREFALETKQNVAFEKANLICPSEVDTRVQIQNFDNVQNVINEKVNLQVDMNVHKGRAVLPAKPQPDVSEHNEVSVLKNKVLEKMAANIVENGQSKYNSTGTCNTTTKLEVQLDRKSLTIDGKINKCSYNFLCDSGAALTAVSKNVWDQIKESDILEKSPDCLVLETVSGEPLTVLGKANITFDIKDKPFPFEVLVIEDLSFDVILGRDFLTYYETSIDFNECTINLVQKRSPKVMKNSVHAFATYVLPAHSETVIPGMLGEKSISSIGLITARNELQERYSVHGAAELVTVSDKNTVPVRLLNPGSSPVKIYRQTKLADFEFVSLDIEIVEMGALTKVSDNTHEKDDNSIPKDYSNLPDLSTCSFDEEGKQKLRDLLYKYRDLFAHSNMELGKCTIVHHTIDK